MTAVSPKTCLLTVTNSCVLRCRMCHLWRMKTEESEVSIAECKRFIDALSGFETHPLEVHIIGGESLVKPGIIDLIKHISDKGSRTVMTSCGYTIDENTAEAIVNSGLSMLNLSLDSLNPEVHNSLRGKNDSHQRLMRALGYVNKFRNGRMKLGINTVISAINLDDIAELAQWVIQNKHIDSIYFMAVMRPFGSGLRWDWFNDEGLRCLWPQDYGRVESVIDSLIALKERSCKVENPTGQLRAFKSYFRAPLDFIKAKRCNVAEQAININALGDAYICFFLEKLGNIKCDNPVELWNSDKAEGIRRKMHACRNNCELVVNCYYDEA